MSMLVSNGLKSNTEWDAMSHEACRRWLARLDTRQLAAQADVRVAGGSASRTSVLMAWVTAGYILYGDALEAARVRP